LNEPQAFEPQVAVQITPAPAGSLVTWALRFIEVLISRELGTVLVSETPMGV